MVQPLEAYLRAMPKVELHVHLEGAIPPETVLKLAKKNGVAIPAKTVEEMRAWYRFTDFDHFVEVYLAISACLKNYDDVELIAREFLASQAAQNVRHTEFTYSPWNHWVRARWNFPDQLAALNRARHWAEAEFGITSGIVIDIVRICSAEDGIMQADWAISGMGNGVVALGLGGPEVGNPASRYAEAFKRAHAAGLPCVPHAGESVGPEAMWDALETCRAVRFGHGFRCLSDPALVKELRDRQIPLEVCPTSNVCVGEVARIEDHPLPKLIAAGLFVTLNSDDPPMFNTTLTDEYLTCARVFGFGPQDFERLVQNAANASLLPADQKTKLAGEISSACARLRLGAR